MKTSSFRRYLLSILCTVFLFASTSLAGDLAPSALPGPTMKNLQTVEPRIPIDSYGFTITEPGSYYLTRNIQMLVGINGINVQADNVTIDLMGFTLSGNGGGSASGIYMSGRSNVEIRNGTIRNFGENGIYEVDAGNGKSHRVIDVRVVGNGTDGIHLNGSGHTVRGCTAEGNGASGVYLENMGSIIDSISYANGQYGIHAGTGAAVFGNTVKDNQSDGIYTFSGTITNNTSTYNQGRGIYSGSRSKAFGNTVLSNSGDGIRVLGSCLVKNNTCIDNGFLDGDGAGIHATMTNNRIEENHIIGSDRGLEIDTAGNIVSGNTVKFNDDNYDIAQGNQLSILLCEVPETIDWPAKVYFAGTLGASINSGAGITVNASNVSIDMAGYSLIGPGAGTNCDGIKVDNSDNLEVKNGSVLGFGIYGITCGITNGGHLIENVEVSNNGSGGIRLEGSGNRVVKCVVRNNGSTGIYCNHNNIISDNIVEDSGTYGIMFDNYNKIQNNIVIDNTQTGIHSYGVGNTIIGNTVSHNGWHGIYAQNSGLIDQNTAIDNDQSSGGYDNIAPCATCTFGTNHAP